VSTGQGGGVESDSGAGGGGGVEGGGQLQLVDFLQMIGICIEELVC